MEKLTTIKRINAAVQAGRDVFLYSGKVTPDGKGLCLTRILGARPHYYYKTKITVETNCGPWELGYDEGRDLSAWAN